LRRLEPQDLYAWRCIDLMERMGEMPADEAVRWKRGIFELMELWGLEADGLVLFTTHAILHPTM